MSRIRIVLNSFLKKALKNRTEFPILATNRFKSGGIEIRPCCCLSLRPCRSKTK